MLLRNVIETVKLRRSWGKKAIRWNTAVLLSGLLCSTSSIGKSSKHMQEDHLLLQWFKNGLSCFSTLWHLVKIGMAVLIPI